jgi:alpha-mannosidase
MEGPLHAYARLPKTPFSVSGAPNVILETIKRSDNEKFIGGQDSDSSIVILRLYEALGGHATAQLRIAGNLQVSKATLTNLLEDDLETLEVIKATGKDSSISVSLSFYGFQVLTVKLVVATSSPIPHADGE